MTAAWRNFAALTNVKLRDQEMLFCHRAAEVLAAGATSLAEAEKLDLFVALSSKAGAEVRREQYPSVKALETLNDVERRIYDRLLAVYDAPSTVSGLAVKAKLFIWLHGFNSCTSLSILLGLPPKVLSKVALGRYKLSQLEVLNLVTLIDMRPTKQEKAAARAFILGRLEANRGLLAQGVAVAAGAFGIVLPEGAPPQWEASTMGAQAAAAQPK